MNKFMQIAAATAAVFTLAGTAQAATIPVDATGFDLTRNTTETSDAVLFGEKSNVTVGDNEVQVDYLASTIGGNLTYGIDTFVAANAETLGAGSYDSFLIHFDPTVTSGTASTSGTFTFSGDIVAIILSSGPGGLLGASDSIFGSAADYDDHLGRRTESHDSFQLLSANQLTFDFTANSSHIDNLRVITQISAVPLPAGALLLLTGLGGLAAARKRKAKA